MCFSWKTHENIGGSLNSVQYNSDIWIFKGIPNVAFVNKCFGKKAPLKLVFIACWGAEALRSSETAAKGAPSTGGAVSHPSSEQGRQGKRVSGAHPLTGLIVRQQHGDRVNSGIHQESPASEGSKAQGSMQAHHWDVSGQNQDLTAHLRQTYLQQSSQGENHKCNKTDATFNDSGQCFKWAGACISNGINNNLLLSAFIIQFSVSERYRLDWVYGKEFHR